MILVIKYRKMRWAMHCRDDKCTQRFGRKNLKGREHLEDLGIVGRIHMVQGRGQWWALVNTVMKLQVP